MKYEVDGAGDEGDVAALREKKLTLANLLILVCFFCKRGKRFTKFKAWLELGNHTSEIKAMDLKSMKTRITYNCAKILPLHRFVMIYGHILVHPTEFIRSNVDIPAFLYSYCWLFHIPKGKLSTLFFSKRKSHFEITSGIVLPSQATILYDPFSW